MPAHYSILPEKEQLINDIEHADVLVVRKAHHAFNYNKDFVFPHVIMTLVLSGTARAMYDMREIAHQKKRPDHHPARPYHASLGLF